MVNQNKIFSFKVKQQTQNLFPSDVEEIVVLIFYNYAEKYHYENTPIQIYRKFHLQKLKIFRLKTLIFCYTSA